MKYHEIGLGATVGVYTGGGRTPREIKLALAEEAVVLDKTPPNKRRGKAATVKVRMLVSEFYSFETEAHRADFIASKRHAWERFECGFDEGKSYRKSRHYVRFWHYIETIHDIAKVLPWDECVVAKAEHEAQQAAEAARHAVREAELAERHRIDSLERNRAKNAIAHEDARLIEQYLFRLLNVVEAEVVNQHRPRIVCFGDEGSRYVSSIHISPELFAAITTNTNV